jgi:glutathione peroxidase
MTEAKDIYGFELNGIDGTSLALGDYRGKVLLVVNVASECGFTPQYTDLEALHRKYSPRGLVVLGVPANEFGAQEPGSNAEIAEFCERRYAVTFPLAEKIVVKGPGQHPLYAWLCAAHGGVTWNFNKFLIGRDGKARRRYESSVAPLSAELTAAIESELNAAGTS